MSSSGSVESGDFVFLLRKISAGEERGLLSIQGEQDLVSVTFERGMIVAADAMNHPADEMLGDVLANEGWLSPADFAAAVGSDRVTGELASESLAAAGIIDQRRLLRAVRMQTFRQVARVLRWRSGNFDWTAQAESPYHKGVEPISVAELLLRAAEELGSEGPLTGAIPELDTVYETNPDYRADIHPLEQLDEGELGPPDESGKVWLTRWERVLYQAIDGRQPASLLMLQTGFDPFQIKYALHTLARHRLIRVRHQVATESPLHSALATGIRSTDILELGSGLDESAGSSLVLDPGILEPLELPSLPRAGTGAAAHDSSLEPALGGDRAGELSGGLRGGLVSAQLEELLESGSTPTVEAPTRRQPWTEVAAPWLVRALSLGLIGLLVATVLLPGQRDALLLPFPWLSAERGVLDRVQRVAAYAKIDQALRTYQLLYGRSPEDLGLLADLELLDPADLYDPEGRWLAYNPDDASYLLQPIQDGEPVEGLAATMSSAGDFLLHPPYLDPLAVKAERTVVLLD